MTERPINDHAGEQGRVVGHRDDKSIPDGILNSNSAKPDFDYCEQDGGKNGQSEKDWGR